MAVTARRCLICRERVDIRHAHLTMVSAGNAAVKSRDEEWVGAVRKVDGAWVGRMFGSSTLRVGSSERLGPFAARSDAVRSIMDRWVAASEAFASRHGLSVDEL